MKTWEFYDKNDKVETSPIVYILAEHRKILELR